MRVAVTGATGNVGTSVLRALARDPVVTEIVGIARRRPEHEAPKTRWVTADVAHDDLEGVLRGTDVLIHLAWLIQPSRDREATRAVNVEGSRRTFAAAARAGVGAVVHASSVGAYGPGPKDRAVDETWPTDGIATSFYSRDKAEVERLLDAFEAERPDMRVVRLRPGLIFQRDAASEIRRLFAGPFLPASLLRPGLIPFVPATGRLVFQAVHADDVAEAYRLAAVRDVRGAFNIAAEPVLGPWELARILDARTVRVSPRVVRALAAATWRLRLQPTPPGWLDLALGVPVMSTVRAHRELGWTPDHGADDALLELLSGMRSGAGHQAPPLRADAAGPLRLRELLTGVGRRSTFRR